MNLYEIKSVDELKTLGKHKDVAARLKELIGEGPKIKTKSWQDLYDAICGYRELIMPEDSLGYNHKVDKYFISKEAETIFYLLELEGECRLKKLGINKTHYSNKKKAIEWRNDIAKIIHPDKCSHSKAIEASNVLNSIFNEMINND